MVQYRVEVKDIKSLHQRIVEIDGTIKRFSIRSKLSESTLFRILKVGRLSYYAASQLADELNVDFKELFTVVNFKEKQKGDMTNE